MASGCNVESSDTSRNELPADLRLIVEAWAGLPDAVRAGILAMVNASEACEK